MAAAALVAAAATGLAPAAPATAAAAWAGTAAHRASASTERLYQPLTPAERRELRSVSDHTLDRIGTGSSPRGMTRPISGPAVRHAGKPEVVFIDAEWCPYCAAERWSLAVALSRFGRLRNATTMLSSSSDVDPDTPTVSFRYARFSSSSISFRDIVFADRNRHRVDRVPPRIHRLWVRYSSGHEPGFPFLYFAGKVVSETSPFDPEILDGHSRAQIAASLNRPSSRIARAVDGGAVRIAAAICRMTANQPRAVCRSVVVRRVERSS